MITRKNTPGVASAHRRAFSGQKARLPLPECTAEHIGVLSGRRRHASAPIQGGVFADNCLRIIIIKNETTLKSSRSCGADGARTRARQAGAGDPRNNITHPDPPKEGVWGREFSPINNKKGNVAKNSW